MLRLLEEARWRLARVVLLFVAAAIAASFVSESLLKALLKPALSQGVSFVANAPSEKFAVYLKICAVVGAMAALPYIIWEAWAFFRPALRPQEVRLFKVILGYFALASAAVGVLFTFGLAPAMVEFFATFEAQDGIPSVWRLGSYLDLLIVSAIAIWSVVFFPLVLVALVRTGILERATLARFRAHAVVASLLLAGVMTPSTDVVSQVVMGALLYGLFELSLLVLRLGEARKKLSAQKGWTS